MLTLLFIGMLTLTFNIQPVKSTWTGTVYIRADGNIDPPDAPITTYDNITYTLTDNITSSADGIVVERSNIIIDGNGYTLQGTGSGTGISLSHISNVTIENTNIKNFASGIVLDSSSNNNISNNNIVANNGCGYRGLYAKYSSNIVMQSNVIKGNTYGIELYYSRMNNISYNNVVDNEQEGVSLSYSTSNRLSNNNIEQNGGGIELFLSSNNILFHNNVSNQQWKGIDLDHHSNNNTLFNNTISNNGGYGIHIWGSYNNLSWNLISNHRINFDVGGLEPSDFLNYIDATNKVNGKPVYYWIDRHNVTIPLDAGYVALINCTHITVKSLTLTNSYNGIILVNTNNSLLTDNFLINNIKGIKLDMNSSNNIISNNVIMNNTDGIWLSSSSRNILDGNQVVDNIYFGIWVSGSSNENKLSDNVVVEHEQGIVIMTSNKTTIINNYVADNEKFGIRLDYSCNNKVHHNNFINNTSQVYISESYDNVWDDGYPSGGNYWSDYTGNDMYCGPYQNVTGSDGIGDTPYVIDENNVDHYPLMNPYTVTPPVPSVINATVDTNPHALNLRSRGRWITAYIELPEDYDVSDINVSTILLNDTIPAEVHPVGIGDYDEDGIPDLMVKFNRAEVISYILANVNMKERFITITLTVTGRLNDGTPFQGSDTIRILYNPRGVGRGRHLFAI